MSQTVTETSTPTKQATHSLQAERSELGLMRPDHSKRVWVDWLTTVDHKKIGLMYGAIALLFLLIGGC